MTAIELSAKDHVRQNARTKNIVLVVPPFQSLARPSMGVSQLKANLAAEGFSTHAVYLNLQFAQYIGLHVYDWIAEKGFEAMLGDIVFANARFGHSDADLDRYVAEVIAGTAEEDFLARIERGTPANVALHKLARKATEFAAKDAVKRILDHDPWFVGFSSSFQQNLSSLAIMRNLKQQHPEIVTALGGANTQDEMGQELFDQFEEIDFVGRGQCDNTFGDLVRALRSGEDGTGIRGFLARGGPTTESSVPLVQKDLDALPIPDFDEYFADLAASPLRTGIRTALVAETARGCWWGAKSHCTFCGLNGADMTFRSKSPDRALSEMRTLVERYGVPRIEVVDNILELSYFKNVLPELGKQPIGELFYETKSNLSREQVETLGRARVTWIQPGIESLSDKTLRLMRKGATELQNIQLLKWCVEQGITVAWNFLFGFPGEDETEIPRLGRDVEAIHHLMPPGGARPLRLDRYSPYYVSPEEWGLDPIRPGAAYRHVYPLAEESVRRIAYFFETAVFADKAKTNAFHQLDQICQEWENANPHSHLLAVPRRESLLILDTRRCAVRRLHRLRGLRRRVYESIDRNHTEKKLATMFADEPADEVRRVLKSLVADRLALEVDGHYLALATYAQPSYRNYTPFPGGEVVQPKLNLLQRVLLKVKSPMALPTTAKRALRKTRIAMTSATVHAMVRMRKLGVDEQAARLS